MSRIACVIAVVLAAIVAGPIEALAQTKPAVTSAEHAARTIARHFFSVEHVEAHIL